MSIIQGNSKTSAAGYTIDQSIRFNDNDSARLYSTSFNASPTSTTTCTFSIWVKRANLGGNQVVFYGGDPAGSTYELLRFDNTNADCLRLGQASSAYTLISTAVFRDPSAWYHIVAVWDTSNATSGDRIRIYVNGSRITSFSTATYPSLNYATNMTAGGASIEHVLGANSNSGPASQFLDGYQAEVHFIDGAALDPTSFGKTDATTGQWVPIAYSGSYGTNGFYITGENSASLGTDYSGNGNNFTSSGLTSADQMLDTPTDNFCTWNPLRKGPAHTLSDGNLVINSTLADATFGTFMVDSGKWYWEITALSSELIFGIGDEIAPPAAAFDTASAINTRGYNGFNGEKTNNGSGSAYGATYTTNDVIGIALNMDDGEITFYKNNVSQGVAFTGLTGFWGPGASVGNTQSCRANFGQSAFTYTPPTGFNALSTANLINTTVTTSGSFTGNGSTDGPFVWLNGIPTAMTINGNSVTFATHADKLANGFKVRSSSASYNAVGSNTYSIATTAQAFKDANAQANP